MPEYMNDDEMLTAERELARLIAVDPSPEFAAQVRARIAQQPARVFAWRPWLLAAAAAAAVVVAIAVVTMSRREAGPVSGSARLQAGRTGTDIRLLPPGVPPRPVSARPPNRVRHVQQTARSARANEPEVLIDLSLARAVRRLAMEQPVLPEVPPEPSLDPVVVEPLQMPDVSEFGSVRLQADQGRR